MGVGVRRERERKREARGRGMKSPTRRRGAERGQYLCLGYNKRYTVLAFKRVYDRLREKERERDT